MKWSSVQRASGKVFPPLSEPLHVVQNIELLPSLAEVNFAVRQSVAVADIYKRQVLQNQSSANTNKINNTIVAFTVTIKIYY